MNIRDISTEKDQTYRLAENERAVFIIENRVDELTFELAGAGAEIHIFSLLSGHHDDAFEPKVIVRHLAPDTISSVSVRARLDDRSSFHFRGRVEISGDAVRSEAREDVRALLLSPKSSVSTVPELEIETDEVVCSHAATIAPPDPDQIHYLETRGLSRERSTALLAEGFFRDVRTKIETLGNV